MTWSEFHYKLYGFCTLHLFNYQTLFDISHITDKTEIEKASYFYFIKNNWSIVDLII